MTKKHFIQLAAGFKAIKPDFSTQSEAYGQWAKDVRLVNNVCKAANPLFDEYRFLTACGMTNPIV